MLKCGATRLLRLARVFLVRYAPCALKQNTVRERRRSPWKRHTRDLWYVCSKIWYQLQRIAGAGGSRERARALSAGGRTSARKHIVCLVETGKSCCNVNCGCIDSFNDSMKRNDKMLVNNAWTRNRKDGLWSGLGHYSGICSRGVGLW